MKIRRFSEFDFDPAIHLEVFLSWKSAVTGCKYRQHSEEQVADNSLLSSLGEGDAYNTD